LWNFAGIERNHEGLQKLASSANPLVRLIGSNSLARCETRGAHHRTDYPKTDPALDLQHFVATGDQSPTAQRWE
jgi:aspartate oxidase